VAADVTALENTRYAATRLVPVAIVIWGVLVAVGSWLGPAGNAVDRWDESVERSFADVRTPTWNTITHWITMSTETPTVVVLTVIAFVALRLALGRWRESFLLAVAVTGQAVIFVSITSLVDRDRPEVPHLDASPPTSSFPSGHTSAGIALYGGLAVIAFVAGAALWLRVLATALAVVDPVAVALSRMYRGMHHPSDVLGSLILAGCWLTAVTLVVLATARHGESREPAVEPVPVRVP
jgi:undecaprenyl-diphosphatase